MKRRAFVVGGSLVGLFAALGLWRRARGTPGALASGSALVRDPAGLLDLRAGFRYQVVQREGETMSDGFRVPGRPDAMACFPLANGHFALFRNHELDASAVGHGPYFPHSIIPPEAYDRPSLGSVTRLVFDADGALQSSNLVLTGTARNCAAGPSPWGYLSCEEDVSEHHGYVFLCAVDADRVRMPQKIPAYGRFLHEAAAVDPADHAAYLTEDRVDGCFYRFVPAQKDAPFGAGRLQALAIADRPRFALGDGLDTGTTLAVSWVDVPHDAGERDDSLRYAAQERGAAVVKRGEGLWRVDDGFVFTSTIGGRAGLGQIFHLSPTASGGKLRLIFESHDAHVLDMPDNLTWAPWGDLIVCEDNLRSPYLRLVTRDGRVLPFAHNARSRSEFAGVCFSPDGRRLFVNMQEEGLTLAIEGPWPSRPLPGQRQAGA